MEDVYRKLARHLDNLPGGFPETESGVEQRILRRLFTPEEAEQAVYLSMMPEPAAAVAARMRQDEASVTEMLEKMSRKGLIFRAVKKDKRYYGAAMFVVGIWEYHVNDLDEELVRDVNEYLPHIADKIWMQTETRHLRVIPLSRDIGVNLEVASYEDAEELIRKQSKIVVQPCICRKEHEIVGDKCEYPVEVCLSFGLAADFYEENNLGRPVSTEEALEILETGRKAGLVLQPGNAQRAASLCMCCGCCCQILKNIKRQEKPAALVHSNYYATVDTQSCTACGLCAERCHMDAIAVEETAEVNLDRCIGCGVCVPACPEEAMQLLRKTEVELYEPPQSLGEAYMKMARERGLM